MNIELDVDILMLLDLYGPMRLKHLVDLLKGKHKSTFIDEDSYMAAVRVHLEKLRNKQYVKSTGNQTTRLWSITDLGNYAKWLSLTLTRGRKGVVQVEQSSFT